MMEKILVIEDHADTLEFFLKLLEIEGFHAIGAENGLLGVQQAKEHLPDLVICDIMMPELDGYGVLTTLRQEPATAIIPFIFLTALVLKAEIRKGIALGADDYLTKPCTPDELLGAIATRLEKQAALRRWYVAQPQPVLEPLPAEAKKSAATQSIFPSCTKLNEVFHEPLPAEAKKSAATQSIFPSCTKLNEVFHFIETNYKRPITLSEVAKAVGYSPTYLTNLVGHETGNTIHGWIIKRRMAAACSLLLETNITVNQIAEAVGYEDASYFCRQFRQLYRIPPKAWRKKGGIAT